MEVENAEKRGMFIFERESFVMRKWQILEFDGKPYCAFVPEDDEPLDAEEIPVHDKSEENELRDESSQEDFIFEEEFNENGESLDHYDTDEENEFSLDEEEAEERETKPVVSNGTNGDSNALGDLYQVKVEGSMVTLEKLAGTMMKTAEIPQLSRLIKEEPPMEIPESEPNEETEDPVEAEEILGAEELEDEEEDEEALELPKSPPLRQIVPRRTGRPSGVMRTTAGPLKCKVCSETFGSAIAFRKHVAWTHKKKVCIQENGAYICAVCDFRTLKKSLFADHLERKHETWTRKRTTNILFPCEACGFVCRSKHSLQSHFIRKHTDSWEHNCQFCTKKFKVKGDLTNHVRFHHKEKPINCDVCGKLCQNTGSLYVHQKWAHYKPKFECHICRRRMVTQENLDQHLITQHEQREKIVCAQCGKTFTKKDSFKRHMAVHTGSKPHSCPICTKPFARQSQLRQHVLIHTGQRPFVCDICGKGFTQKPGLICHRKTHPGPLPPLPVMPIAELVRDFIAQNEESQGQDLELENPSSDPLGVAPERISARRKRGVVSLGSTSENTPNSRSKKMKLQLKNEDIQEDDRQSSRNSRRECSKENYQVDSSVPSSNIVPKNPAQRTCSECHHCGKKFVRKSKLIEHLKQHRHICTECPKTFSLSRYLESHIDKVHSIHQCSVCNYKSNNKGTLKNHFIRLHTSNFEYSCETCGKQFKIKKALNHHVKQYHSGAPPIVCDVCGHFSKNLHALKAHMKYRHYKPEFVCKICSRGMTTKENLEQHLTWHETREKVLCPTCGKRFRGRDLDSHMRVHTGVKPFTCPVCGKNFRRQTAQEQHVLIHTGKRPYICDICGQSFAQKPGLICHRKRHPGPLPPLPIVSIKNIVTEFTREYANKNNGVKV